MIDYERLGAWSELTNDALGTHVVVMAHSTLSDRLGLDGGLYDRHQGGKRSRRRETRRRGKKWPSDRTWIGAERHSSRAARDESTTSLVLALLVSYEALLKTLHLVRKNAAKVCVCAAGGLAHDSRRFAAGFEGRAVAGAESALRLEVMNEDISDSPSNVAVECRRPGLDAALSLLANTVLVVGVHVGDGVVVAILALVRWLHLDIGAIVVVVVVFVAVVFVARDGLALRRRRTVVGGKRSGQ